MIMSLIGYSPRKGKALSQGAGAAIKRTTDWDVETAESDFFTGLGAGRPRSSCW